MKRFAVLLDQLAFQPSRTGKIRLLVDYFANTRDPARGLALAAVIGDLSFRHAKPSLVRGLAIERVDPVLFELSYDYVGDLAETVALIWPPRPEARPLPSLPEVVEALGSEHREGLPATVEGWLDALDATGRWALIKLITGALRVGVSAGLARAALAEFGGVDAVEVQEAWYLLAPPYAELFAWLEGRAEQPTRGLSAAFRPVMLAQPLAEAELARLDPRDFRAEWKWDGVRVQIVGEAGRVRLYARSGDEIGAGYPDLMAVLDFDATLDGELLVIRDGRVAPFAELQRRLNRRTVSPALQRDFSVAVRLYDILFEEGQDLRPLPFDDRRQRLERWHSKRPRPRLDLSPLIPFRDWDELRRLRRESREPGVEGVMLKRADSPYLAGRPKGPWFKWKRDPATADAVLMYAQRGHGKRSSFYSDYTFGVWRGDELVPVGKAYFGFTDAELRKLDRWVRTHTTTRFGPVREVERSLVLEVAFDGVQRSKRHKAGVALRFPRISRIRWDKPAEEADKLEAIIAHLEG